MALQIGIIGPGRLGRSLHVLWQRAGHDATLVGREAPPPADVWVLTVPDHTVASRAAELPAGTPILHCAGALSHEVLRPHRPVGSFHPLMTFPGPEVQLPDLTGVPAATAGDPEAIALARELAEDLGMDPFDVPGDRRLYHAAAVIAGNLGMVLLADAARVLAAAGVPLADAPKRLIPLAVRSLQNASHSLRSSMTGPVARGEADTLNAHRKAMDEEGLSAIREVYDTLVRRAELHIRTTEADE